MKKKEKGKYELIRVRSLMNSLPASKQGRRICLLEFAFVLKLKGNKTENSSGKMQPVQMYPP